MIVVGAGIVGLFTALKAASLGLKVAIVEAESAGSGASGRNAGVLHVIQPPPGMLRRRLAAQGLKMYPRILEELNVEGLKTRLVIPAFTALQELLAPILAITIKAIARHSKPRIVSREEALDIEPLLNPKVRRAVIVDGYITVNPLELISRLLEAVTREGVEVIRGKVDLVKCDANSVQAILSNGDTIEARVLVNAAGTGANEIARQVGIDIDIRLAAGAMTVHRGLPISSIIAWFPTTGILETKGGAIIPWPTGDVILGPTFSKPGEKPHTQEEVVQRYSGLLREEPPQPKGYIVGYRTMSPQRDFILQDDSICRRTVHALGIESPGLTAAPAIAEILVEMVLNKLK